MEKLVITNKGKELLTSLVAGNKTITFTRVDISAHDYKRGEIEGLTTLEEVKQISTVSDVERIRHDVIRVKAAVDNRDVNEGYYIRAVGLYVRMDEIEYLFGVSINPQPDFMPAKSKTVTGLNLSFNIKVDNAESVSVVIPSEAYASAEQVAVMRQEINEKFSEVEQIKTQLEGSVESKLGKINQDVSQKLTTQTETVTQKLKTSAEQRFKDLYGLADKTVTISTDNSTIIGVTGDVKVTTTINKSETGTNLTTIVEKGVEGQDGFERYTKTTVMSTLTDGRKQVTVNYTKNV